MGDMSYDESKQADDLLIKKIDFNLGNLEKYLPNMNKTIAC